MYKVVLAAAAALVALCLSAAAQPHGSWPPMGSQGHHHGGHLGHPMPHNRVAYAPLSPLHSFAPGQQPIVPSGGLPIGNWHNGIGLNGNLPFGSMPSGNMNNGIGEIGSVPNGYMPTGNVQSGYVPNTNVMNANGLNPNWLNWYILYRNRLNGIRSNGNRINRNVINRKRYNSYLHNRNWMNGNSLNGLNGYLPNGNIQSSPMGNMYNGYTQNGMIPNGNWLYGHPATIYHPNWKDTNFQNGIWQNGNMPYGYLQNAMSAYNVLPYGSVRSGSDGNEDETAENVDTPEESTPNPDVETEEPAGEEPNANSTFGSVQTEDPNKGDVSVSNDGQGGVNLTETNQNPNVDEPNQGAPNQGTTSDDDGITKKPDDLQEKPSGGLSNSDKTDASPGKADPEKSTKIPYLEKLMDDVADKVVKELKGATSTEASTTKDGPATTTNRWPGMMQGLNPQPTLIPMLGNFHPTPLTVFQSPPKIAFNLPNLPLNRPLIWQPYTSNVPASPSGLHQAPFNFFWNW